MVKTNLMEEKAIISLYCVNKQVIPQSCNTIDCKDGECLCLDEEQLALLHSLIGKRFVLNMEEENVRIKAEDVIEEDVFCKTAKENGCKIRLISCKEIGKENLQEALKACVRDDKKEEWKKVIKNLPLLQYVNSTKKIVSRNSICYLCLYGEENREFLQKFLNEILIGAIELYINDKEFSCALEFMDDVLKEIDTIYNDIVYKKFCDKITSFIDQYEKKFKGERQSLQIFRDTLQLLYENLENESDSVTPGKVILFIGSEDEGEISELIHLYRLVKAAFRIMGSNTSSIADDFFCVNLQKETKHNVYSELLIGIESLKDRELEEKKHFLNELKNILQKFSECADEDALRFKTMCTQNI